MMIKNKELSPKGTGTGVYKKALVITIIVFFLGLFVGLIIERLLLSDLGKKTSSIESSIQEIELEMLYFQGLNENESCTFLKEIVRKTNNKLDVLADQLGGYSDKDILFTGEEVANIKTRYTSLLVKSWLLQEKIKRDCNSSITLILYFYSIKDCDNCLAQGEILMLLKDTFKDRLMIFPLDINANSEMVNILMLKFNVTSTPSLVVSNRKYEGLVLKNPLKGIICTELQGLQECS